MKLASVMVLAACALGAFSGCSMSVEPIGVPGPPTIVLPTGDGSMTVNWLVAGSTSPAVCSQYRATQTEIEDLAWPKHDYSDWRFDETSGTTATDSSDNAIPTVLAGGVTWATGRLGGAIDFPGGAAGFKRGYHHALMDDAHARHVRRCLDDFGNRVLVVLARHRARPVDAKIAGHVGE